MNRRSFTKSIAALFTLPVLPAPSFAAPVAVAAVPSQARFWAIYMTGLHGKCPPQALQTMLNIPAAQAQGYINQLVLDGVIKPNHLLDGLKSAAKPKPKVLEKVKEKVEQVLEEEGEDMDDAAEEIPATPSDDEPLGCAEPK